MRRLRWDYSEPSVRSAVDAWARDSGACDARVLSETPQRRLIVLETRQGQKLLVKQFNKVSTRHAERERWKRRLGLAPCDREWRALHTLRDLGVPAPQPVGRARWGRKKFVLVYRYLEGQSLQECLRLAHRERRIALLSVGGLVRRLHATQRIHGDLHVGNVLVNETGAALLDVQRSRRSLPHERLRELADLDFSLRLEGASIADRVRVRRAALDASPHTRMRREVRRIGQLSLERAHRYFRGRTRRCLRAGRRYARVRLDEGSGMRVVDFPEEAVREALARHRAAIESNATKSSEILKSDHRSRITAVLLGDRQVVVKEVIKSGRLRRLADLFRGSPARRAWLGGHGLLARGLGAATPLAFVETRSLGVPIGSAVVLEDLRPALPVSESTPGLQNGQTLADWLLQLALRLHRAQVLHGDLQALHIYARPSDAATATPVPARAQRQRSPEAALIDLEGVRFRRRLRDRERIQSLAELNASIEDERLTPELRREAFDRYGRALPFANGSRAALAEIVQRSLARRHAWTGDGCGNASEAASVRPASR